MRNDLPLVLVAGNPNVGKTSLFNAITGLRHKVANYPGVTVEKRIAYVDWKGLGSVEIVDLPGTYSLHGESPDEIIAARNIVSRVESDSRIEVVVVVVDASSLERNLFLVTQIIDIGKEVVIALNMLDIAKRHGLKIHTELLARDLGVPIVPVSGSSKQGVSDLVAKISCILRRRKKAESLNSEDHTKGSRAFHVEHPYVPKIGAWCEADSDLFQEAQKLGQRIIDADCAMQGLNPFGVGVRALSSAYLVPHNVQADYSSATERLRNKDIDPLSLETSKRFHYIEKIVSSAVRRESQQKSSRLDHLLLHRIWGLGIFAVCMILMFQSVFTLAAWPMECLGRLISAIGKGLKLVVPEGILQSLLVDGIVAGVGSVVTFLPQIVILYGMISLLEDSGYLARVAFLMDRVMRVVGLQGRSFVPLLNSFGCAIPGIMATRTIPSFADRMRTILIAPLLSCSARVPVYTLLIAAFIPNKLLWGFLSLQGLVLFSIYLLSVVTAAVVAFVLRFSLFRGEPSEFVLEMPVYRIPSIRSALIAAWDRGIVFLRDAGTVILACSIVMWFLSSFPHEEGSGASKVESSYAGQFGKFIEPMIRPLGFDWRIGVAIIGSFAAREAFVSTLALVHNLELGDEMDTNDLAVIINKVDVAPESPKLGVPRYGIPMGLSLMVFYCFCCQCFPTLAVCKRETNSVRWALFMFVYMTSLAYIGAWITYNLALIFI